MTQKKEFSAIDAAPVVLYAKLTTDDVFAYPVIASTFGTLVISAGFAVPYHDQEIINEADPNNVIITYKRSGASVATKTIVISGSTTTITIT